jgi:hypothetical protein
MRKIAVTAFALLIAFAFGSQTSVSAQFTIKVPKIPKVDKPKEDKPQPDAERPTTRTDANQGPQAKKTQGGYTPLKRSEPDGTPRFLKDSLEIKVKSDSRYWKFPNQNDYTSWLPQVSFDLFFDNSVKLRYTAEWYNPDGTLWYTEPLDVGFSSADATVKMSSPYSGDLFATKATVATGAYGLKITNSKNGETVFQGKFKVNKIALFPGDARLKNRMLFYVDNDWHLPVGYVGLEYSGETSWDIDPAPIVYLWFKGDLESKDFEARLFQGAQEIASTDDGGYINTGETRGEDCFQNVETCKYKQWMFYWNNFKIENNDWIRNKYPKATFTRDKPGEYTVKIFHRGVQVREAKFTIDSNGWIAPNAFSSQLYMPHKTVIPVKVMGTLDKWNAAAWKTDAFYGNPLSGFNVP